MFCGVIRSCGKSWNVRAISRSHEYWTVLSIVPRCSARLPARIRGARLGGDPISRHPRGVRQLGVIMVAEHFVEVPRRGAVGIDVGMGIVDRPARTSSSNNSRAVGSAGTIVVIGSARCSPLEMKSNELFSSRNRVEKQRVIQASRRSGATQGLSVGPPGRGRASRKSLMPDSGTHNPMKTGGSCGQNGR